MFVECKIVSHRNVLSCCIYFMENWFYSKEKLIWKFLFFIRRKINSQISYWKKILWLFWKPLQGKRHFMTTKGFVKFICCKVKQKRLISSPEKIMCPLKRIIHLIMYWRVCFFLIGVCQLTGQLVLTWKQRESQNYFFKFNHYWCFCKTSDVHIVLLRIMWYIGNPPSHISCNILGPYSYCLKFTIPLLIPTWYTIFI